MELGRFAGKTLQGIKDATASGDWQAVVNALWTSLKLAWTEGTTALRQSWADFQTTLVKVAVGAWSGMLAAAECVRIVADEIRMLRQGFTFQQVRHLSPPDDDDEQSVPEEV